MGMECRDINGDGRIDLATTTYHEEMPLVYLGEGEGYFSELTNQVGIDQRLRPHVNWGIGLEDFDNDSAIDLFVACGHFMDNIQVVTDRTQMKVSDFVQRNRDATFARFDPKSLAGVRVESSRGSGFGDLDRDGDVDAVILNFNAAPSLLENRSSTGNWISVALGGTKSTRDAAGAVITIESNDNLQTAVVALGRGYQSHYGQQVHFGLGNNTEVEIRIEWPSGKITAQRVGEVNRVIMLIEPN